MTFRPDIEGLRALSILFVVLYHYFPTLLPGGYVGVDVFFVVSGYLITLSLLKDHDQGLGVSGGLAAFWARRARRLLPNALLVLIVVSIVGLTLLSDFALKRLGSDVFWSAAYAVNWLYVLRSLDYLQWDDSRISVLLNYWSLSVEEQFYFVWPALLLLAAGGASLRDARSRRRATWLAVGLCVASLAYCLVLSSAHLTLSFFSSPARAWELLAGAALAVRAHGNSLTSRERGARGAWVIGAALLAMAGAAVSFGEDTVHPGWPTLLPVAGAAGVIAFGVGSPLAQRWLGSAPLRAVGARSYSIYLWHWPVLVLGRQWLGNGPGAAALLLIAALVLAELAYRMVELPARFRWARGWSVRRVLTVAVLSSAGVVLLGAGLRAAGTSNLRELLALKPGQAPGARPAHELQRVANDLPDSYRLGCHLPLEQVEQGECVFGDPDGSQVAVLFGDSHAAQWLPALDIVARRQGYRLHAWTKSSCPSAEVSIWNQIAKGAYRQCDQWRETMLKRIEALAPRAVILSNLIEDTREVTPETGSRPIRGREAQSAYQQGLERTIRRLRSSGAAVVVIRDTPRPRPDVMDCLGSAAEERKCELSRVESTSAWPVDALAAAAAGAALWDFTDDICPAGRCPVSAGPTGSLVYRDSNHLTVSYVRSLAPAVEIQWRRVLGPSRAEGAGRR